MLQALANPILPVFMVLAVGYGLRLMGVMQASDAQSINKIAYYLAVPALAVSVISKAPITDIEWAAVLVYFAAQMLTYGLIFVVVYLGFKRELREALLLGMAAAFTNHIFFVLPIAERMIGPDAALPMAGIVMIDAGLIFPGSVLTIAIMTARKSGKPNIAGLLFKNPFLYAPPVGIVLGLMGDAAPAGLLTFVEFAGAAAAPVLLFTLGITLAGAPLRDLGPAVWAAVGGKLLLHPVLVWAGLGVIAASSFTSDITLLVAAGPCGAMPFVIATQYNIRVDAIAKAVLISTILSIFSLSVLAT